MATQVIMPSLGESVVEGTLTRWLKQPGEHVEQYEPLVEVNTDKVDTEVPSPASGVVLEVLVPAGTVVQAGTLLAIIGEAGEEKEAATPSSGQVVAQPPAVQAQPAAVAAPVGTAGESRPTAAIAEPAAPGRDRELGFISPVVARMAAEHNIDLFQVPGTGQSGRITKRDIERYLENLTAQPVVMPAEPVAVPAPQPDRAAAPITPSMPTIPAPATPIFPGEGEILPLTTVRRSIAEHMVHSKHTSPHVTTIMEVDFSRVVSHRQANKDAFAKDGVNLTFTAYFVAAAVAALKAFPLVNSSWTDEGIRLHHNINIGMATSLGEAGLIVPVIKDADGLSLLGLARAVNDLAGRARARKLKPDEVKGGTFSITNHGISGSLFATPIINQPQCGILSVGKLQKRVVVVTDAAGGDSIAIRPMVYVGLTFDHRILDGASADNFLAKVVDTLEKWG